MGVRFYEVTGWDKYGYLSNATFIYVFTSIRSILSYLIASHLIPT